MAAQKRPSGRITQSKKQAALEKASPPPARRPLRGSSANGASTASETVGTVDAADTQTDRPRYGAGALILTFLGAQLLSSIAYMIATSRTTYDFMVPAGVGAAVGQASAQFTMSQDLVIAVPPPLWLTALLQLPLWFGLGVIPIWFAVKRGRGVVADLGLRMRSMDIPIGLAIGVFCQLVMVPVIYLLLSRIIGVKDVSAAARQLTDRASSPISVVLLFLIVGIGAPIAEEIYFRGMAQGIFGRRLRPMWAVLAAAAFFAATHLQPLQFPALLAFGIVLGLLRWRTGRLGPSIWAHLGFNVVAAASLVFGLGVG
ncbi:MAG: CPBP family intramembrane metalloprotease [Actinobacteria bacterium]|nr:CPBP family intramembrane metalloprotease [Actinomycetota bacterium]